MSDKSKKKKVIIAVVLLLIIAAVIGFLLLRNGIRATSMRVIRLEGGVNLQDEGIIKTVKENLRLNGGNVLDTAADSSVSIGLDEVKVVTLDQLSCAEFNQDGKYLNLELTRGNLFFEVSKPLADDETFEIETSTMVVGVRGTSGWVSVENGVESLILTDGHVHIIGTNPVTGEVKEIDVRAGQKLRVYLYNDRNVDSIMFELEDITERELPMFVLLTLRQNIPLVDKVVEETGWDRNYILGIAEEEIPAEPEPEPEPETVISETEPEPEPEPEHEHEYVAKVTKPATCGATGERTYTCECGDTYTEVIPATENHTYVAEVVTEANCVLPGVMNYTCSVCGDTYSEAIPATGIHNFEGGTCQTHSICTICGAEGPLGDHHFVWTHIDEQTHEERVVISQGVPGQIPAITQTITVVDHPAYDDYQCEYCGISGN